MSHCIRGDAVLRTVFRTRIGAQVDRPQADLGSRHWTRQITLLGGGFAIQNWLGSLRGLPVVLTTKEKAITT